jgi:hypothetical protein
VSFPFSPRESSPTSVVNAPCLDIERTYEPHTFIRVPWIEGWFRAQVFAPDVTDFGSETRHFKTGVAKDNPAPVVPGAILNKLMAIFEAKLRRKKVVKLTPLVPRKPSVEVIKKASTNKLKKRPSDLNLLHSNQSQPQPSSPRPGTPTSQNSDTQNQRQTNKLRKRSRSSSRPPESVQPSLPVRTTVTPPPPAQAQAILVKDKDRDKASESITPRHTPRNARSGPPPSPSNGKRFEDKGVPRRGSTEKVTARPLQRQVLPGPPSPPLGGAKRSAPGWEMI